jgi:hypothetical protein
LARSDVDLLVPDFWLYEACNVLSLRMPRELITTKKARDALTLLRDQVEPTPTADPGLHGILPPGPAAGRRDIWQAGEGASAA